jgi:Holliday junction resolvase RusA-like endonuclease
VSKEIQFTVLGKPEPAGSKKAVPLGQQGRWGVVDDNPKAKAWKKAVGLSAFVAMAKRPVFEGGVIVEMEFVLARPKGHWNTDWTLSAQGRRKLLHTTRPDALKLARAVEDGMTGYVYLDDGQIVKEIIRKRYVYSRNEEPHVRVTVRGDL